MKKVSLREIVADKIVFAILIALYYWMWARNDWHNYYTFNMLSLPLHSSILSPAHPVLENTNRNYRMKCLRPT